MKNLHSGESALCGLVATVVAMSCVFAWSNTAMAATPVPYFNGFETDTSGWSGAVRVQSGTDGIPSATGAWHAKAPVGPGTFTDWGGYTDTFPATGYTTAVDVYLDVEGGWANDTRFDWTSAINNPAGIHRRDFAFNGGFYSDLTGPGTGPRFVFSASNNTGPANSFPKNPARDPVAIMESGWYTFQHDFYDGGGGVLAVDLSILEADGTLVKRWTLSDPSDLIGTTVGGNRYGWFAQNEFSFLAFDNSLLFVQVGPPTSADQCKKGGWETFNTPIFKNQGDCVKFVKTGK